jgi:regulator of ribosome biosynthesis
MVEIAKIIDETQYALGADAFAETPDDGSDSEEEESSDNNHNDEASEINSTSSSDDEEEEVDDREVDNEDDDDSQNEEETNEEQLSHQVTIEPTASGEPCLFDLRNLVAMNSHQVSDSKLYSTTATTLKKIAAPDTTCTIPPVHTNICVNEDFLLDKATDGATQLIRALWQLPTERSDAGPLVTLPTYDEIKLPRSLPPPPPKAETRWEAFAKSKGIATNKNKRSRKVLDEATGEWMYRHGYQKANDDSAKEWPIMEVRGNDDPYQDPWEARRDEKRARTDKNSKSRMKNLERAGELPKGTANKTHKQKEQSRIAGKHDSLPAGVPVDLRPTKGSDALNPTKRGKESIVKALRATQASTASLGKFDKMREGEPERKRLMQTKKEGKTIVTTSEAERSFKVFKSVVDGGGVAKERDVKKGKLAKGETAYDYEFDDGLGASSFRKKKGRAGAGKPKKMTKRRIK